MRELKQQIPDRRMSSSRNAFWTVMRPFRHPQEGTNCCRCRLIIKKLRWCDSRLRLIVLRCNREAWDQKPQGDFGEWQDILTSDSSNENAVYSSTPEPAEPDSREFDEPSERWRGSAWKKSSRRRRWQPVLAQSRHQLFDGGGTSVWPAP